MISYRRKLIFAAAIVASAVGASLSGAQAQSLTSLNGITLSGSAPTGFTSQAFEYNCTSGQALCWPQISALGWRHPGHRQLIGSWAQHPHRRRLERLADRSRHRRQSGSDERRNKRD